MKANLVGHNPAQSRVQANQAQRAAKLHGTPHPEALSRRDFLRIGGLGFLGLTLPEALNMGGAEANAATPIAEQRPNTYIRAIDPNVRNGDPGYSVILIHLMGGASPRETWDPLPNNIDISQRGPFTRIPTNVPGIFLSEKLERTANIMDKLVVLRHLRHDNSNHPNASALMMSGSSEIAARGNGNSYHWDARITTPFLEIARDTQRRGIANSRYYVLHYNEPNAVGNIQETFVDPTGGSMHQQGDTTYLRYRLNSNPTQEQIARGEINGMFPSPFRGGVTPDERLDEVVGLINDFERNSTLTNDRAVQQHVSIRNSAISELRGGLRFAFDLEKEPTRLREHYGKTPFGDQFLTARRLVEAGVRVAYISTGHFDHHYDIRTHAGRIVPQFDKAFAALINDVEARGLPVVLAVFSEFGRTPVLNTTAGRDHWPGFNSAVLYKFGGRGGQAIGTTTNTGTIVGDSLDAGYLGDYIAEQMGWRYYVQRGQVKTNIPARPLPDNWSAISL